MTDPALSDAEKAIAYAKTVGADAVKDATTVQKDVQAAKTEVVAVESKLSVWVKAHASTVATVLLVAGVLLLVHFVWHLL